MFVTPALAQAAGGAPAGGGAVDIFTSLMPILLLVVIFWLLIFRPQGIFGDRKELAIDAR